MESHFLYFLYSSNSDIYYVGESADVHLRLLFHNHLSANSFTAKHRPWTILKAVDVNSRSRARKIERYIKKRKSRKFIEDIIHQQHVLDNLLKKFPWSDESGPAFY